MKCPNCNSYVSPEWDFCKSCGKPIDKHLKVKRCEKCDEMNLEFATHCEKCGAVFGEGKPVQPEKKSIWDSWLGITVATAVILLIFLFMYLLIVG